jgi:hypothetical protein
MMIIEKQEPDGAIRLNVENFGFGGKERKDRRRQLGRPCKYQFNLSAVLFIQLISAIFFLFVK